MWIDLPSDGDWKQIRKQKRKNQRSFKMVATIDFSIFDKVSKYSVAIAYRHIDHVNCEILFQSSDWRYLLTVIKYLSSIFPNFVKDIKIQYCGEKAGVIT